MRSSMIQCDLCKKNLIVPKSIPEIDFVLGIQRPEFGQIKADSIHIVGNFIFCDLCQITHNALRACQYYIYASDGQLEENKVTRDHVLKVYNENYQRWFEILESIAYKK